MQSRLQEISLVRPLTIVMLVVMHAFTMYAGNWTMPEGIHPVQAYWWLQKYSFSCMLEMFVFVSGYVFGYQIFGKGKVFGFAELLTGKLKRLILPSVIFSALYILLFTSLIPDRQWGTIVLSLLSGYAHLWFLPMLFWCFVAAWLLLRTRLNAMLVMVLLVLLAVFSYLPLPLQMNMALYYLPFFWAGICLYRHRSALMQWAGKYRYALYASVFVFLVLVYLLTNTIEVIKAGEPSCLFDKVVQHASVNLCKLVYSSFGVAVFYLLALLFSQHYSLKNGWQHWNSACFAIYIYQQFLFEWLYYHTSLPQIVGSLWLPWCGLFAVYFLSLALALITMKTKTGRFLLG